MIRTILAALGMLMLAQGGCVVAWNEKVEKLKWLENSDAEEVFETDLKSNRSRFFVVNSYTQEILGVGRVQYERCYSGVELTSIDGTSDALENREHARLNRLARIFAKTYNLLAREYLDRLNGKSCPKG